MAEVVFFMVGLALIGCVLLLVGYGIATWETADQRRGTRRYLPLVVFVLTVSFTWRALMSDHAVAEAADTITPWLIALMGVSGGYALGRLRQKLRGTPPPSMHDQTAGRSPRWEGSASVQQVSGKQ